MFYITILPEKNILLKMNFDNRDDEISLDRFSADKKRSSSNMEVYDIKKRETIELYFDLSDPQARNPEDNISEPTNIDVYINPKTSLIEIHNGIRMRFIYEKTKIEGLRHELKTLNSIKNNMDMNVFISRKNELLKEIRDFDVDIKWIRYKENIVPILEKYIKTMPPEVRGILSFKNQTELEIENSLQSIVEFIDVSNSICNIRINSFYQRENDSLCQFCENPKQNCNCGYMDDSFVEHCEDNNCGELEKQTNINPKPQLEWLKDFLAEGDYSYFDADFFADLDEMCIQNDLPTSSYIKAHPIEGTRELLRKIVKMSDLKYKYTNALGYKYWNWERPQMTEEQKEIFKGNCIITRKEYPKISKRKQNLNLELSGYLLLGLQELTFPTKYFTFPTNLKIIRNANEIWTDTCKSLKIENYRLIVQ